MANAFDQQQPGADLQTQPQLQQSSGGKGCLWGCLIAVGLVVCVVICMGLGSYWFISSTIAKYTSDQPMDLQVVELPEEEMKALQERYDTFRNALNEGETPEEDLILTADEINALLASNEDVAGRVFVKIEDDQVKGDVSAPLDALGMKGRYFNGSGTFDVSMEDGVLIVVAQELEVNGEPVPEQFMQGLRGENLAKDAYKDPDNAKFLRKIEEIHVEGDKIILRVRRDGDGEVKTNPLAEEEAEADGTEASGETAESESAETESAE